jgi:hypothetical protein
MFGSIWPSGFQRRRLKFEKFTNDALKVMTIAPKTLYVGSGKLIINKINKKDF